VQKRWQIKKFKLHKFQAEVVQNYFSATGTMGYGSIVLPMLILPSTVALLSALFNFSLLLVTVKKVYVNAELEILGYFQNQIKSFQFFHPKIPYFLKC
jgi:hypothetical protein